MPRAKTKTPSLHAQHISDECWYYENAGHLDIIYSPLDASGQCIRTYTFSMPWRKLLASARRCQPKAIK